MSEEEQFVTLYQKIGGETEVKKLVEKFYDFMDQDKEFTTIREMHKDLNLSREKLFMFLSGWMGGPQIYIEKYGHPRLRARHLPFPIGVEERDEWLNCMYKALTATQVEEQLKKDLMKSFYHVADFMRNKQE